MVENATDEDWKDVRMALVSGRPISFQMDLYTPLYVPRPTVVPELFASLRPVTYSGDLNARDDLAVQTSRRSQAESDGAAARRSERNGKCRLAASRRADCALVRSTASRRTQTAR